MRVLALDTSCVTATAAVMEDNRILAEYATSHKKTHSTKLLPMINEMMRALELSPKDIDLFAAAIGPGSFTGLRIGVVTIKGLAYALDKPVVSIPTLDAMAYQIPQTDAWIYPIMDARNRQVYTACYRWQEGIQTKYSEYMGITVEELVKRIKNQTGKVIFLGDAVEIHKDFFRESLGDKASFADSLMFFNRASSVAALAFRKYNEKQLESCFSMKPFYLRKSQAERMKELADNNEQKQH